MNKIKTTLSLFMLLFVCIQINFGQTNHMTLTLISPGIGAGHLNLGMSKKEVKSIINSPYNTRTFEEECKAYSDNRYHLDSMVQCRIGFDEVWDYEPMPDYLPIFKLFFKKNELCYIILSSYGYHGNLNNFELKGGIHYHDSVSEIIKIFGQPELKGKFKDFNDEGFQNADLFYEYWSKGIEFYIDDEKLTVIYLFKPVANLFSQPVSKQLLKVEKKLKDKNNKSGVRG